MYLFRPFFIVLLSCYCAALTAQSSYKYAVDLNKINNDQLTVTVEVPSVRSQEVIFRFPRMVPGIYGILDQGRNIDSIWAYDNKGKPLHVDRLDTNGWKIRDAINLHSIRYVLHDDWDDFRAQGHLMYRSPGSMFSAGHMFLINNSTLFGYIDGMTRVPVQVVVDKPDSLYAATSLMRVSETARRVTFSASDYHQLVDNPILFAVADTAHITLGDVDILVACHSTSGQQIAKSIASYITPLLRAQKAYLGGKLPVNKYTFIIYHEASMDSLQSMADGLEHSQSTVILLHMFLNKENLNRSIYGIAAHEFFHVIMPLALHSEEIEYYNFNHPTMSRHLWLYEGMTEYFTIHMPVVEHLESLDQFLPMIGEKIKAMHGFDSTLSITTISERAVERQDQYMNVYNKGALICLCLDIHLRELSQGKYGVQNMIADLLHIYGRNKPFKDAELFDAMAKVTGHAEVLDWAHRYISGTEPLPLRDYLNKAGLVLNDQGKVETDPHATPAQLALRKAWLDN